MYTHNIQSKFKAQIYLLTAFMMLDNERAQRVFILAIYLPVSGSVNFGWSD